MAQNPDKIPHSLQPKYRQKERTSLFTSRKTSIGYQGNDKTDRSFRENSHENIEGQQETVSRLSLARIAFIKRVQGKKNEHAHQHIHPQDKARTDKECACEKH